MGHGLLAGPGEVVGVGVVVVFDVVNDIPSANKPSKSILISTFDESIRMLPLYNSVGLLMEKLRTPLYTNRTTLKDVVQRYSNSLSCSLPVGTPGTCPLWRIT